MKFLTWSFIKKFTGKEVKNMRVLLSIIMTITMVISTSGLSFAEFSSIGKSTFSASGTVGGSGGVTVAFSANLKNITGDTTSSSVTWSTITAGTTGWLAAQQYIAVQGFATYSDWGIQIYTNNTNYTGSGDPAGLINQSNTIYSLPMAWRTKTTKLASGSTELSIIEKTVGGYAVLADGTGQTYYPWFYMLDKRSDLDTATAGVQAFGNYQEYATFIGSKGYQHAPSDYATPSSADMTYYVYLGAKFTQAAPGATYATSSLTVEMYRL
ncbi:MAG: hypothetical protein PHV77_03875 [Candidatus Omnitrophica bacterium]|jgi:hypothetical protein|nr:hypothetical protein [Candidatus Omnitrophota bacterium]